MWEVWGDVGRCGERWGELGSARSKALSRSVREPRQSSNSSGPLTAVTAETSRKSSGTCIGRCGEMWGDVGRCGEIWGGTCIDARPPSAASRSL